MLRGSIHFGLGVALASTIFSVVLAWNSRHVSPAGLPALLAAHTPDSPAQGLAFRAKHLTGTWEGKESGGITYTITRNADGTFTEIRDSSPRGEATNGDVHWHPPVIRCKGRWSLAGSQYAYYYTQSTDPARAARGPWIITITMTSLTELTYNADGGIVVVEHKE